MIMFYAIPPSLYCAKTRILLRHKGLDWREVPPPGGYGSAEYKQIVASGNLPALVLDGMTLADSEAIAEYLNEIHPDPAMLPADPRQRAQARERGRLHDTRTEPALRRLFAQIPACNRNATTVADGGAALGFHLEVLARHLVAAPLPEDRLWLCDCGFAISFEWIAALEQVIGLSLTWPEPVVAYRARLARHPAVAAELAAYLPHLDGYLDGAV